MAGIEVDGERPAVAWVTSLPSAWRVTESERLVLLCLACDAFKWESAPGYEAVAEWTGMLRTSCIRILGRLCEETDYRPALLERISSRGRRRTVWHLLGDSEPVDTTDRFAKPAKRRQPTANRSTRPTGSTVSEPVDGTDRLEQSPNRSTVPTGCDEKSGETDAQQSPNRSVVSTAPFSLTTYSPSVENSPLVGGCGGNASQQAAQPAPKQPPADRGTRIAEDWMPSESTRARLLAQYPDMPPDWWRRTLERFRNYWLSKAGKDARKVSWDRTFANWVHEQVDRDGRPGRQSQPALPGSGVWDRDLSRRPGEAGVA